MPVGHTHNDVDQYFSVLASHLKKTEISSFENLVDELKKLKMDGGGVPLVVQEIKSTSNFQKLFRSKLCTYCIANFTFNLIKR